MDYDDMRDWQYREENPGYERSIGLTASDLADCDPEMAVEVAGIYARDNRKRQENNLRADNARLRALLKEHGIDPDEQD
jgi:hypothetical protein